MFEKIPKILIVIIANSVPAHIKKKSFKKINPRDLKISGQK